MASDYLSTRRFSAALVDMTSAGESDALFPDTSEPGGLAHGLADSSRLNWMVTSAPADDAQDLLSHRRRRSIECQDPERDCKRMRSWRGKYQALRPARPTGIINTGNGA